MKGGLKLKRFIDEKTFDCIPGRKEGRGAGEERIVSFFSLPPPLTSFKIVCMKV
mgnify:CR=1 FL=1